MFVFNDNFSNFDKWKKTKIADINHLNTQIINLCKHRKKLLNPKPIPQSNPPVGVSIIIVKIYYYSLPLPPVQHLCRKNSIAKPRLEISTSIFWVMSI